jgi:hypothetical protein
VITGENLGNTREIRINDRVVTVFRIRANSIKGTVPVDVRAGKVTVQVDKVSFAGEVYA